MQVSISWSSRISASAQLRLERSVRDSLRAFFKHYSGEANRINLIAFAAERGVDGNKVVRLAEAKDEYSRYPGQVPVLIHLEGTQGLRSLISVPGMKRDETLSLIQSGPYRRKPEKKMVSVSDPAPSQKEEFPPGDKAVPSVPCLPATTSSSEVEVSEQKTPRFCRGWFNDQELVKFFLLEVKNRFTKDEYPRQEITGGVKDITGFTVPIDVAHLFKKLIFQGIISPGTEIDSKGKPTVYHVNHGTISKTMSGVQEKPAKELVSDKDAWKEPLNKHWRDPARLQRGLLLLCREYPEGRCPSAVGVTRTVAAADGDLTFKNRLMYVIPEILVDFGFIKSLGMKGGHDSYELHYDRIGVFLSTGKFPNLQLPVEVPVPVPPVAADPFDQLRRQYEEVVAPLEAVEQRIAERHGELNAMCNLLSNLEARSNDLLLKIEETKVKQAGLQEMQEADEQTRGQLEAQLTPGLREKLSAIIDVLLK